MENIVIRAIIDENDERWLNEMDVLNYIAKCYKAFPTLGIKTLWQRLVDSDTVEGDAYESQENDRDTSKDNG